MKIHPRIFRNPPQTHAKNVETFHDLLREDDYFSMKTIGPYYYLMQRWIQYFGIGIRQGAWDGSP